jgi:hypothetical protein
MVEHGGLAAQSSGVEHVAGGVAVLGLDRERARVETGVSTRLDDESVVIRTRRAADANASVCSRCGRRRSEQRLSCRGDACSAAFAL